MEWKEGKLFISLIYLFIHCLDVAAEKTKNSLVAGIESFNPSKLKHTETQEKNQLPDKQGE